MPITIIVKFDDPRSGKTIKEEFRIPWNFTQDEVLIEIENIMFPMLYEIVS